MAEYDDKQQREEIAAYIFAIGYNITAVISVIALLNHTHRWWQDFFTKPRQSIAHRRWNKGKKPSEYKPKITRPYTFINRLMCLSSLFYTSSLIAGVASPFSTTDRQCDIALTFVVLLYQCGKSTMYIVFILRLYRIYEKSPWNYPKRCVNVFIILILIIGIIGVIIMIIANGSQVYNYGSPNKYPNWCGPDQTADYTLFASYLIVQDFAAAIGFITAYVLPLRKIYRQIYAHDSNSRILKKLVNLAHRTTIVTCVATISTIIFLFLTALLSGAFSIIDTLVNQLCVHLFSSYYPDWIYDTFCKPCTIFCATCCPFSGLQDNNSDVAGLSEQLSRDDDGNNNNDEAVSKHGNIPTVDTWSAVRIAGANVKIQFDYLMQSDGYHQQTNIQQTEEKEEEPVNNDDANKETELVSKEEAP